jgi:hypothetical protein
MEYSLFKTKATATNKAYLVEAIKLLLSNLEGNKRDYKVYNILNIGRLLEGEAYYHEVDQYYRCVGFEVEIESQIEFQNQGKVIVGDLEKSVGFYSIWVGKSHSASPITFEEGYRDLGECHRFDNGLGDHIEVMKEIVSLKDVQEVARNNKLLS